MCSLSPTDSAFIEATVEEKTLVLSKVHVKLALIDDSLLYGLCVE